MLCNHLAVIKTPKHYYDDIKEGQFMITRLELFGVPALLIHDCLLSFHHTFHH